MPQQHSKTNFKAFGHHVFGDIDVLRLGLCLGRNLALPQRSFQRVTAHGTHFLFCGMGQASCSMCFFQVATHGNPNKFPEHAFLGVDLSGLGPEEMNVLNAWRHRSIASSSLLANVDEEEWARYFCRKGLGDRPRHP